MSEFAAVVVGVVLGFGLGFMPPWLDRNRRMKLHWQALKAENLLAAERVDTFLKGNIQAPLYRLPKRAYDAALKALVADAANLTVDKIKILYEAADLIADVNRGLEICAQLAVSDPEGAALKSNYDRNIKKAERLAVVVLPGATKLVAEQLGETVPRADQEQTG